MKILHITPSYKPAWVYGGPTRSLAHLCEAQAAAGWKVEVITTLANGAKELPYTPGIPHENNRVKVVYYTRITGDHSHFSPALLWNLLFYIRQCRYVHIHSWWNLVAMPAVFICWLAGRRPLLSPRGMLSPYTLKSPFKRLFHTLFGRFLLRRTVLHATSNQELEEGQAVVKGWQGVVVGNIVSLQDDKSLRDDKGPLQGDKGHAVGTQDDNCHPVGTQDDNCHPVGIRILFLSRIHPKKGLDVLLEALSGLSFPWQLSVVGDGEEAYVQQLMARAQELGLANNIHWRGWLDGQAKTALLQSSDLMVLPSHNENFAHVVLEALGVGTPVLISDQVGLKDYVLENDLGWVCSLQDDNCHPVRTRDDKSLQDDKSLRDDNCHPVRIREALETAWSDTTKRERIRTEAPAMVRRDFDPQVLVEQYRKAYEKL